MFEFILEQPFWVLGATLVGAVIALWRWIQTGQTNLVLTAAAFLAVGAAVFALGSYIETEKEMVRRFVLETAANLEANHFDLVRASIHDRPSPAVISAVAMLDSKNVQFDAARVKKIHSLEISGSDSARRVQLKMNVFVEGSVANHPMKIPAYIEVVLYKVGNRWMIQDFRYDHPMEGFKNARDGFLIE